MIHHLTYNGSVCRVCCDSSVQVRVTKEYIDSLESQTWRSTYVLRRFLNAYNVVLPLQALRPSLESYISALMNYDLKKIQQDLSKNGIKSRESSSELRIPNSELIYLTY